MLILKHKSLNITVEEILEAVRIGKPPTGMAMNLTEDAVIVEPLDCINLLGEIGDDYESLFYEEVDIDRPWSEIFSSHRAATGLSQVAISKKLGIPRRTIENWETGKAIPPEYVQKAVIKAILALN